MSAVVFLTFDSPFALDRYAAVLMHHRAVNAAKVRKNDIADSEFCEGRRKISVNERNNLFFVGSGIPDKNGMIPVVLPQIIRRSAVL